MDSNGKKHKTRTIPQNSALHQWCTELANESNNHGVTQRVIMEKIEVDWTMESVKSLVQAILRAKYGISKTSLATTVQLSDACAEVGKIFAEHGIHVSFPSFDEQEMLRFYDSQRR